MNVYLIGGGSGEAPFGRSFFNTTLGDLVGENGKAGHRVTLYLVDGHSLDICSIDQLSDQYVALRAYGREADACDTNLHLLPYHSIYRIEIGPAQGDATRVGFQGGRPLARKRR